MIFSVEKMMPNNRAFVKGEFKDLVPGETIRVKDGFMIKNAVVETRYSGGAVVNFRAVGA